MHLLNIWFLRKSNLKVILPALLIVLVAVVPIILYGKGSVYFSIDPDVVYVANALSFIRWKILSYTDHPGILAIYTYSLSLIPYRIYAKYFLGENFIQYFFDNQSYFYLYLRMISAFFVFIGLSIYFKSIQIMTKNTRSVLFALFGLMTFTPLYYFVISISAEAINIFLTGLWLLVFSLMVSRDRYRYLYLLSFISGLAFSNRATSIVLILMTGYLYLSFNKNKIIGFVSFLAGLCVGLLPSSVSMLSILKKLSYFAGSSGVHGSGAGELISIDIFLASIKTFIMRDTVLVFIVLFFSLLFIYRSLKNRQYAFHRNLLFLTLAVSLLFSKFFLAHYQASNILVIFYFLSINFSKLRANITVYILTTMFIFGVIYPVEYITVTTGEIKQIVTLENWVKDNQAKKAEIWEWARSEHFTYLWTNTWGSGVYKEVLDNRSVAIYSLDQVENLFDVCWDKLYMQKPGLDVLLNKHPLLVSYRITPIEGTQNIIQVDTEDCITKP